MQRFWGASASRVRLGHRPGEAWPHSPGMSCTWPRVQRMLMRHMVVAGREVERVGGGVAGVVGGGLRVCGCGEEVGS